jgi:hypothetical protein
VAGRNTQGVKLVNLDSKDLVMAVARVVPEEAGEAEIVGADGGGDAADDEADEGGDE